MSYVHHTVDHRMIGFVGDPPNDLWLGLYCDSDFAGGTKRIVRVQMVYFLCYSVHVRFSLLRQLVKGKLQYRILLQRRKLLEQMKGFEL